MEHLIEKYLLQKNYCPLPGLGCLLVETESASINIGDKLITAPTMKIVFSESNYSADAFLLFISKEKNIEQAIAEKALNRFVDSIKSIDQIQQIKINKTGAFYKDYNDVITFKNFVIPSEFAPAVPLERVIHPNSSHQIIVGDKERSNIFMTDSLLKTKKSAKSKWWIAAVVFALIGIGGIVFFYACFSNGNGFGNIDIITPKIESSTYSLIK